MYWGLILKHNKKYSQTVKKAFHLSSAALDTSLIKSGEDIQVLLNSDDNVYLLCTLNKEKIPQFSLDLNFAEGDKICFSIKGEGIVHLSGFLIPDVEDEFMEDEEDEETVVVDNAKSKNTAKLEKKAAKALNNDLAKLIASPAEESDSDDMDDTFEPEKGDEDDSSDDAEEEAGAEAEGSDDDEEEDDDDDDDEDDDDDDDDEEEEVQAPAKKAKLQEKPKQQNGLENGKAASKEQKQKDKQQKGVEQNATKTVTGGVQIQDLKPGNGPAASVGKKVCVYYEGRLKQNNKVFDSTKSGAGFKFRLGGGEVIKGWDVGVVGMKVGGKRRITCPPNMAYGQKGSPPVIPPNSTLVFDVELKNVN